MTPDAPIAVAHAEIRPEFHQFVLGVGNVLLIAEQLSSQAAATASLGVATSGGVLFSLVPEVIELSVTVEIWAAKPQITADSYIDMFESQLVASDTTLYLTSITPSPDDLTMRLPEVKPYTVQAFVLAREIQHDADFSVDVSVERWLIRLW
jgi:hypothetical protein